MPNASHLVKDDQSPVVSSFRSPAMTFAGRVVVMNGGRIEQIGRPRAKREASPNQSVALVVPRGGVQWASNINAVRWQTATRGRFAPQRFSGAVSNRNRRRPQQHSTRWNAG
jgi:ABC-type sugar transport system ATPase subunit